MTAEREAPKCGAELRGPPYWCGQKAKWETVDKHEPLCTRHANKLKARGKQVRLIDGRDDA